MLASSSSACVPGPLVWHIGSRPCMASSRCASGAVPIATSENWGVACPHAWSSLCCDTIRGLPHCQASLCFLLACILEPTLLGMRHALGHPSSSCACRSNSGVGQGFLLLCMSGCLLCYDIHSQRSSSSSPSCQCALYGVTVRPELLPPSSWNA